MEAHVKDVVHAMTEASDQERITFSEVVKALAEAGVERYLADLVTSTKTYYLPDGSFETVACHDAPAPAVVFSPDGVKAAVRAIQQGRIRYMEFCAQVAAAGCVGYFVTLAGRRAVYYGRDGETYVEWFPGTKPD